MNTQRGVSLISLLIGLLVSMITIVGMMMIFRNTVHTVVPASEDARSDGERVSGLLAAHIMINDAGFGIENPQKGTHLQVLNATLSGSSLSGSSATTGNAVVWAKNVGGNSTCEGLFADGEGRLLRISSDSSCSSVSTGISGTSTTLIQPSRHPDGSASAITISMTDNSCRPLGVGSNISGAIRVTIKIESSTQHEIESTTCLPNF